VESPSQRWSIRRRAFSSDAPATSPDAPPPVTHLLTAYDMNAAPAMQVTPLRLAGTGAERHGELGSRLWRAIRLARDVRREGTGVVSVPELFAPAPRSWGEGVALRLGARGAVTDAVEASLKAENDAFALVEEPARALDEALVRSHPENRAAYAAVLREALYAHAAEVAFTSRGFEVSRTRDHGVRFVETTTTTTSTSAAVVFETAIDVDDGGAARLVASTRALAPRSKRTVRDLLDDPSFVLRSGLELVASGARAWRARFCWKATRARPMPARWAPRAPSSAANRSWSTTGNGTRRGSSCCAARTRARARCGSCRERDPEPEPDPAGMTLRRRRRVTRSARSGVRWRTRRSC